MKKISIFIAVVLLLALCATPAYANGIPALPHAFYGIVTVNGSPAPNGTQISATVDEGDVIATQNPVTTVGGSYGIDGLHLLVQGDIPNGATITFYVNGVEAEGQTDFFEAGGGPTRRDLSAPARPVGGGGGGGDTTAPRISNVLLCPEGVTETTADICWVTDELSTSQVEYWTSPSMLSPLDETYVIEHHVHLSGLTPGTTYHYKTMSRDRAGNLAVSDEYTFTTLGEAPEEVLPPEEVPPEEAPPEEAPPEEVPPPAAPPEVKPPINWALVGGIIAGVVVVGLLIFFLVRRRTA